MRKPVTIDACMANPPDAEFLRHYLADRDAACANCGYNLRGLTNDRCPECGLGLVLQIGLQEPRQGAFLAGVIGLAAGVGFSGLLLLYAGIRVLMLGRGGGGMGTFLVITASGLAFQTLALLHFLKLKPYLRKCSSARRALAVITCWLLSLANLIAFTAFIR